jgi:hypothetical protein
LKIESKKNVFGFININKKDGTGGFIIPNTTEVLEIIKELIKDSDYEVETNGGVEMAETLCDRCGINMTDKKGNTQIGILLTLDGKSPEFERFKETFGKTTLQVCFTCWGKSLMGILD